MQNLIRYRLISFILFVFFVVLNLSAWSQTAVVKGKIVDAMTNESVPFANVFLNNTTLGAASDENGVFVIKGIKQPAAHELVVSFVGYDTYITRLNLSSAEVDLGIIRLMPNKVQLSDVEVKSSRDIEWERKMKRFTKVFLGADAMASQCKIVNPWVINFQDEISNNRIIASATEPIMIENHALGYTIAFYLKQFVATNTSYSIKGDARFQNMVSANWDELKKWEENRKSAYFGSSQHLFKSILDKRIKGEGFNLYQPVEGFEKIRSSLFSADFNQTIFKIDTTQLINPAAPRNIFKISWNGIMETHYTKKKSNVSVYQDIRYPISWLTSSKGYVLVNEDGIVINPGDLVISGAMSENRIAHMLPLDYVPLVRVSDEMSQEERSSYSLLFEKIYLHTDKPYYYPGETIWMRGYINYSFPYFRDSLSSTVYVELIRKQNKKILQSRILEIDSGFFQADFILPDTLFPADYFIRAYTNWNRNYSDDNLYMKYLPVLNLQQKPKSDGVDKISVTDNIEIIIPKDTIFTGEEISLQVKIVNANENPVSAKLSVSVTDANQVLKIPVTNIIDDYPIIKIPEVIQSPNFAIEYGLTIRGQVKFVKSKMKQGMLNVFQPGSGDFYLSETDLSGIFQINGLKFYGSSNFIVQHSNVGSKGRKVIKDVKLVPRGIPDVYIPHDHQSIQLQSTSITQRESSSFELPAHTRLLEEVIVRDEPDKPKTNDRSYGKPDYIIRGQDLNQGYGNLLLTLQGKIPGLIVRQDPNGQWLVYVQRAGTSSISNVREVLVMVDDVFVSGEAADILSSINIANVESVEVKTGVNVLYGGMGGSGIVSVYTRNASDVANTELNRQHSFSSEGYYKPRDYYFKKSDDSNVPDYRSLLYWNSELSIRSSESMATFSFIASDLPGPYRVVIEGVTEKGEVVRGEKLIDVRKRENK